MTRDQVLRIATQCGDDVTHTLPEDIAFLERFAEAVAAEEREACARTCESIDTEYHGEEVLATWCAEAIRARGER